MVNGEGAGGNSRHQHSSSGEAAAGYSGNAKIWKGCGSDRPETIATSVDIAGGGKRYGAATTKRKKHSVGTLVGRRTYT